MRSVYSHLVSHGPLLTFLCALVLTAAAELLEELGD
jgi:hypothetical protein